MQTEISQNHSLKYKYIIRHLQRIVISEICCRFPIYFFRLDSILKKTFMLLKRDYINKVKVIRKYMSSTLTEIFTSQKTLGQCTDQIFTKSSNKLNDGKNQRYVPLHFLRCEIVEKGHGRA